MRVSIALLFPLLALLAVTLAQPTGPAEHLSLRESDSDELGLRALEDDLERRGTPYKVKPKPVKVSKATQQTRKSAAKAHVAQTHIQKALKKQNLAAAYASKKKADPNFAYKKPRSAKTQKPNQRGYRADGRAKGFRLQKQPKTPKPQAVKGAAKTQKHKNSQAAANARTRARKDAGKANFAHAKTEYGKTTHMPKRGATFKTPVRFVAGVREVQSTRDLPDLGG